MSVTPKLLLCSALVLGLAAAQPPKIPPRHTMTIKWSGQGFDYEHNRGYDIDNQLYRDQSISTRAPTPGQVMLQVLERPQLDQKAWQSDLQRMVCTNWTFTSRINGFVNNFQNMVHEGVEVKDAVACDKWTAHFDSPPNPYNYSAWFDQKTGYPVAVYNSDDEAQGAVDGGIKHITNFNTDIPDDYFTCKSPCECQ